jgi:hypothetical protein
VSDPRVLLAAAVVLVAGIVGIVIGLVSCEEDEKAALPTGSTVGTPEGRAPFDAVNGPEDASTAEALEQGYTSALGLDAESKAMVELGTVRTPDWTAEGIGAELASPKLTDVSVTGGGATVGGIQRILAGRQCMTVYEPVAPEARAARSSQLRSAAESSPTCRAPS